LVASGTVFLRSLTAKGFKSFADRTTLEFTPGISVIVGPNGSGKSNIADAIAWVLGEQGPRALRGAQMADVIFAGSPGRPALGMAEVSMVIDNTAGLIPVPATEIEISRIVYRSGESEYRLGGRPCRLMDIQELLSDTGIGRALHTLIGQGHLEDVLTAKPEDRRVLIEEAAGIAKHRRRRERAERKLAGVEHDLVRLHDVLAELKRQLKPLRQQAELAARHEQLTGEAADLAWKLAAVRLRDLHGDRERRTPGWREVAARQDAAKARLGELDELIERLDHEAADVDRAERRAEEGHTQASRRRAEAEGAFRQSVRQEAGIRDRLSSAEGRSARLFALTDELDRTERALAEVSDQLAAREQELAGAEAEHRRQAEARRDAEADRERLEREQTARRVEQQTLARTLSGHEVERAGLTQALRELRDRRSTAEVRLDRLTTEIERLDASASPLADRRAALEREARDLERGIGDLEAAEKGLLARQEVVDARIIELAESPGAAFARRRGDRPLGVLRELVSVPPDLRHAARAALGPFGDAVVYADADHMVREAEGASGGVTLVSAEGGSAASPPGAAARPAAPRLLDLLRPDPRVADLVGRLIGDVYLAASLAEAVARRSGHPALTFVTRDGHVVGPGYVRTPTGVDARVDGLRRDSAALERELGSVRRGIRESRARLDDIGPALADIAARAAEVDRRLTVLAEELAAAQGEAAMVAREEHLLKERAAGLDAAVSDLRTRLAGLPTTSVDLPTLPPTPDPPVAERVDVEALRRERARLETGASRTRREVDALGSDDPVVLRADLAEAERRRVEAEEALRVTEVGLESALSALREATEAARRAQAADAEANRAWREQAAAVERLRADHEQEDRARADLERRIADAERLLREGHHRAPEEALASLGPEDSVEGLQRQSDLVVRRLGLLGRVNLLAVGELEAVQERYDFLARELDDVKAARRDLVKLIEDVDLQMAEQFAGAFMDVSAEFAALFGAMFPGGEGALSLTDPDDVLGTGIEIEARPGGKRVKRLSLLSGGERSLAALCFLFAVFRARPSPFYLMDEVEAALDDVNLSRFLDVLKGFAETAQILVVTHQKRTMECGDVLYGVSMGRDGASTVISQRLADVVAG
jgi:chromosome segregation protein